MSMTDVAIRLIVAAAILAAYFFNVIPGIWAIILLIVAGIFLLTSIVQFCPLYSLFGISTCKVDKAKKG